MAVFLACAFLVRYCSASVFHIFPSWGRFSVIPAPKRDAQKSRPIWPKQSYFHLKLSNIMKSLAPPGVFNLIPGTII